MIPTRENSATVYTPTVVSDAAWDSFVTTSPNGHILQTTAWGKLKSAFGWQSDRVAVQDSSERLAGGALILFRRLPIVPFTIAYIPRGPVADWDDSSQVRAVLNAAEVCARRHRAILLKIEPEIEDRPEWRGRMVSLGFRPSPQTIQPRRTMWIDLCGSEEEILNRMKGKTRYNIRLGERKGLEVHAAGREEVEPFYRLMTVTGERDAFSVHSLEYYRLAYDLFVSAGQAELLLATFEGRPLAGLMIFACGRASWYFYGASSNEGRNLMPTYLLQWRAMQWARERGCERYDLWGVPDADEAQLEAEFARRSDELWGVYRFKRGFGGRLVRTVGAWDHPYQPWMYQLYLLYLKRRPGE